MQYNSSTCGSLTKENRVVTDEWIQQLASKLIISLTSATSGLFWNGKSKFLLNWSHIVSISRNSDEITQDIQHQKAAETTEEEMDHREVRSQLIKSGNILMNFFRKSHSSGLCWKNLADNWSESITVRSSNTALYKYFFLQREILWVRMLKKMQKKK